MTRSARLAVLTTATMLTVAAWVAPAMAESKKYSFKDPKGVNSIGFFANSSHEPIFGIGSGVDGQVTFDPANPGSIAGSISVDATTLTVANGTMTKVMLGKDWLKTENNPKITFTINKVVSVESEEGKPTAIQVMGTLSLAGIDLPKTVTIKASHLPDGAKVRGGAEEGDLLVLRSTFTVDRTDFGIKPDMTGDKVSTSIAIMVAIVGYEQ